MAFLFLHLADDRQWVFYSTQLHEPILTQTIFMFLNLYLFALACLNNSDKDFYQCTAPWLIGLASYIQGPAGAHHLRFCQVLAKIVLNS